MASLGRQQAINVGFTARFVHRVRFTRDVFGPEATVLVDLLEPSGDGLPRVQFWLDENVALARPGLQPSIDRICTANRHRFASAGHVQLVPGGEAIKNDIHILERMLKVMHAAELDRRSYVVVIGGGAVLDAVGFAAAIAHRGIRLVRLPTTTLSQADSGIGVKNGVNLFQKKNWLGTFAVPWGVINDTAVLDTLSDRDYLGGFSEAVKVSLLKRRALFDQLERAADAIRRREERAAGPIIRQSAELHLEHIARGGDPFETKEARPLDFGHWLAHRLESLTDFQLRHGEAVAIGVAVDSVYSSLVHGLAPADGERILQCLGRLGCTVYHPAMEEVDAIFAGLEEFRQHLGGRLTLTMLRGIGEPCEVHDVDRGQMAAAISRVAEFAASPAGRSATSRGS